MPRAQSRVNPKEEFNEKKWLISVVNTGSRFSGHSVLVVEGFKPESDNNQFFTQEPKLFIGRYDIIAMIDSEQESSINTKGYIKEVRITEENSYREVLTRDYTKFSSKSYLVDFNRIAKISVALRPRWIAYNGRKPIIRCPSYGVAEKYASCFSHYVSFCVDSQISAQGV